MSDKKQYQNYYTKEQDIEMMSAAITKASFMLSQLEAIWRKCGEFEEMEAYKEINQLGTEIMCRARELIQYMDGTGYYDPVLHPYEFTKYTQSQLDDAIVKSASASARAVMQAYDNNMKYIPEAIRDSIVDEAIVEAQKKYTQKDLDDAIAALATGKKYEIIDGEEPFQLVDETSSTSRYEPE